MAGDEQTLPDVEDVLRNMVSPSELSWGSKRSRLSGRVVKGSLLPEMHLEGQQGPCLLA